jgi:ATP-dependent Lon protease
MLGYIEEEKAAIASRYLLNKQLEAHGIENVDISFEDAALSKLIRGYTREAGVRQLERNIGKIVRKLAVKIAGGENGPFIVSESDVVEIMGPEKFTFGVAEENDEVGVVTGLAVNAFGGDILPIEVSLSEGSGKITLTGQLGDVMRESAQAGLTYARANARLLELESGIFDKINVHIHVPDGATPKDGPSAGVSMCTALVSVLTGIPVRADVAMTGEITLRGEVLPIGGLKEKLLAALRGGIQTVLIPDENRRDLAEIPANIKQNLEILPVKWIDEVFDVALKELPGTGAQGEGGAKSEDAPAIKQSKSTGKKRGRLTTH